MKFISRLMLILLALSMLLCSFAACTGGEDKTPTYQQTQAPEDPKENLDENGYLKDDVPDGLNFNTKFNILASENQKKSYWAAEDDPDVVAQAVYNRNATVQERLSIEFEWDFQPCYQAADKTNFAKAIETDVENTKAIDMVVCYNLVPYRVSWKGCLSNLADTEYIDLEKPWWPKEYLENMLYRGKLYAVVSNTEYGTLSNLTGVFFNNTMLEAKKIETPYNAVKENRWTLATLRELTKDTYQDANNNDRKDHADIYGVCTSTKVRLTCWYYAAGVRMSEVDENGKLVLTGGDVQKVTRALDAIKDLFNTNNGYTSNQDGGSMNQMFAEQRAYFYLSTFALAEKIAKEELGINYGIVPTPKLTSEQTRYYIHIPNMHDTWCIPVTAPNQECSSAVIELMASEAYRQVVDVFYEKNLKLRYAPDERLAEMYDLIRESIVFDFVYIHKESMLENYCDANLIKCLHQPNSYNWKDTWDKVQVPLETKFEELVSIYDSLP